MIMTIGKTRGYFQFVIVMVVATLISWSASGIRADLPLADGPRVVRQFLVAFVPALGASLLLDPIPELSASLVRVPGLKWVDVFIFWTGISLALVPGWSGIDVDTVHYEMLVALVLCSVVIVVTAGLGEHGSLVGAILGVAWTLFGTGLGIVAGFPGAAWGLGSPAPTQAMFVPAETAVVVLGAIASTIVYAMTKAS